MLSVSRHGIRLPRDHDATDPGGRAVSPPVLSRTPDRPRGVQQLRAGGTDTRDDLSPHHDRPRPREPAGRDDLCGRIAIRAERFVRQPRGRSVTRGRPAVRRTARHATVFVRPQPRRHRRQRDPVCGGVGPSVLALHGRGDLLGDPRDDRQCLGPGLPRGGQGNGWTSPGVVDGEMAGLWPRLREFLSGWRAKLDRAGRRSARGTAGILAPDCGLQRHRRRGPRDGKCDGSVRRRCDLTGRGSDLGQCDGPDADRPVPALVGPLLDRVLVRDLRDFLVRGPGPVAAGLLGRLGQRDADVRIRVRRRRTHVLRAPARGGPPGWSAISFGDAVAFDTRSRLYVTWHSIAPNWTAASVYVANSTDLGQGFESSSFTTRLQVGGGNSTAQENLALGLNDTVYLLWVAFDPSGDPNRTGIFVRGIAGAAKGNLALTSPTSASVDVQVRDASTGAIAYHAAWDGSPVTVPNVPPASYEVRVSVGNESSVAGRMPVRTWGRTTFTVHVTLSSREPPPPALPPWQITAAPAPAGPRVRGPVPAPIAPPAPPAFPT